MAIFKEFQVHSLDEGGIFKMNEIAKKFNKLLDDLIYEIECPDSREFSITRTKLEEACFFAKKSIAMSGKYEKPKNA